MRTSYAYGLLGVGFILLIGAFLFNTPAPSYQPEIPNKPMANFSLTSSAFSGGDSIPSKYTCDGAGSSPPLHIVGVPEGTKVLALIMEDPDVPKVRLPSGMFDHWILYGIPPDTEEIPEAGLLGSIGINTAGAQQYAGPCPPPEYEPSEHRYFFTLYALNDPVLFEQPPTKQELLDAIQGKIIGTAELVGKYKREKSI